MDPPPAGHGQSDYHQGDDSGSSCDRVVFIETSSPVTVVITTTMNNSTSSSSVVLAAPLSSSPSPPSSRYASWQLRCHHHPRRRAADTRRRSGGYLMRQYDPPLSSSRDWNTFSQYLMRQYDPPLSSSRFSAAHVLEFLGYMDRFGKIKIHDPVCPWFGLIINPRPAAGVAGAAARDCPCPLCQAWGSLDALVGRLRAAFEEKGSRRGEGNPFGERAVKLYLREVREFQSKARDVSYKKQRKPRDQQESIAPGTSHTSFLPTSTYFP